MITYNITPVSKPRQTQSDKWNKRPCVLKYRAFADQARNQNLKIESGNHIKFVLPMPSNWSKKKRIAMDGKPHTQRPDIDNLIKALLDAVHKEDCHIWRLSAEKLWGEKGSITVQLISDA